MLLPRLKALDFPAPAASAEAGSFRPRPAVSGGESARNEHVLIDPSLGVLGCFLALPFIHEFGLVRLMQPLTCCIDDNETDGKLEH